MSANESVTLSGSYENDVHRRSATVDLQKRILALETEESRAVSYADYYAEKQAQGRINGWVLHPPAEINLPLALQVNLPGGGERDVVKPFWKNILNQNQLMRGLTNAYEVANLGVKTPDISFFQDHIDKPSAAEFVACGDCKGSTWTGTSNAELGQVMLYAHRILDANPLRVHVYGFITNNQRVVLIKGHRQQERPFAVYWDISSPLAFQAGMSAFLYLLQNDNGYEMPPSICNSIVTIKKPLRPGGTCRAFTALYNSQEVVAKLYREVDIANSDASKIGKARQVMQDSTSDKKTALVPTVVAAEGRWLLITPVGIAFTASTLRLEHLEMILETLKIIHASNIVHRDVRFSNIFQLDGGGNVLLNDWGSSTEGGTLQMVQGCPEPWCHPDLVNVSEVSPETKHDLYSLVSSTANLLSPGLSAESHRLAFAEAFQAAEKADHDGVAQGFKAAGVKPS